MNKSKLSKAYLLIPLALLCCFLWGSAFPMIKTGYRLFGIGAEDTYTQILFAGIRFFIAGAMVIAVGSVLQKRLLVPKGKKQAAHVAVLSLFQTILQYTLFYIGLAHTSGVKSSVLESVSVFFSLAVSALVFRLEKLNLCKAFGAAVGFAGVIVINLGSGGFGGGFSAMGEGAIIFSALAYAVSSALIKRFSETDNTVMLSGWQFLFGGAVMIAFGFAAGGRIHQALNLQCVAVLLYLAFISAAAYTVWGILLKYNPVSKVSVIGFMNPVFGVLLSAIILGETAEAFNFKCFAALALVCIGIFVVNTEVKNKTSA